MPLPTTARAIVNPHTVALFVDYKGKPRMISRLPIRYLRDTAERVLRDIGWAPSSPWYGCEGIPDQWTCTVERRAL